MVRPRPTQIFREPLVHFFILGALLFAAERFFTPDPRVIEVTPGLRAELGRRFLDLKGHAPSPTELETELTQWKRDEALYREALLEGVEKEDADVRQVLVGKMRARADVQVDDAKPTDDELKAWLEQNRSRYESAIRYAFEFLAFPRSAPHADGERDSALYALSGGKRPSELGRPLASASWSLADMQGRIAPELIAAFPTFSMGTWQKVDGAEELFLARITAKEGGLPELAEVRPLLTADWSSARRKETVERKLDVIVDRYRVEEKP